MTAAYFFPLQNVCFLFFPIVDFKTFRDTYRPGAGWRDASGAIVFLLRGLSHLLIYRIKYYLLPSPHQLSDAAHVAWFLAANYALYLHVSGYFHIITGLFHLFGFELPRTHHNYFLASSFTDIWRRINIPWKEFMAKLFFFPVFFATRGWGTRRHSCGRPVGFPGDLVSSQLPGVLALRQFPAQHARCRTLDRGGCAGSVEHSTRTEPGT